MNKRRRHIKPVRLRSEKGNSEGGGGVFLSVFLSFLAAHISLKQFFDNFKKFFSRTRLGLAWYPINAVYLFRQNDPLSEIEFHDILLRHQYIYSTFNVDQILKIAVPGGFLSHLSLTERSVDSPLLTEKWSKEDILITYLLAFAISIRSATDIPCSNINCS